MKVTANIATYPPRMEQLKKMLPTIIEQFDEVRICLNQYNAAPTFLQHPKIKVVIPPINLTDNGKFMFLEICDKDELYCTLDDDILYPDNYRVTLERNHYIYPDKVLTFHGRVLKGIYENYYKAPHKVYRVFGNVQYDFKVDVGGTGVMAFKPFPEAEQITRNPNKRMTDILMGIKCAKIKKDIICLSHKMGWFKPIKSDVSIMDSSVNADYFHSLLCKKIYELNYK